MKTLELYVAILRKIRFETLGKDFDLHVCDYDSDDPTYRAITIINEVANDLTPVINMMEQELSIIKEETK